MFRVQNNVPEIYVDGSRDFQLLCRLLDLIQGSIKYSIDSTTHSNSPTECNSKLLTLLAEKLGLSLSMEVDDADLRLILQAFPSIIRYKGSERSVKYLLNLVRRIVHDVGYGSAYQIDKDKFNIKLQISSLRDVDVLLKLLCDYILPVGFTISYEVVENTVKNTQIHSSMTRSAPIKISAKNSVLQGKYDLGINSTDDDNIRNYPLINEAVTYYQEEKNEEE